MKIRFTDNEGRPMFCDWSIDNQGEPPEGAVEVDRFPAPGMSFEDFIDGAWVTDTKGKADAKAGPEHIAEAHIQKRVEAILIGSGIALTKGLLFEEANALNVPLESLAAEVMTKSAEFSAVELARKGEVK